MATLDELLKLVSNGKATLQQKIELSNLLSQQAAEEKKADYNKRADELKAKATELGFSEKEAVAIFKGTTEEVQEVMFECEINGIKYTRLAGQRGKCTWSEIIKANYTKGQALAFVKGQPNTELNKKGTKFVDGIYK